MRKLLTSVVIFISLLSGSASSVNATSVANSSDNNTIVRTNHEKKQRDHVIYNVRKNRITNHSNRPKVVVLRFNGREELECKLKKHETVEVFGHNSKIPTLLNHTKKFLTKQHIKVTYDFQNHFSKGY